ncbi:MAG TPA: cytochrome c [Candidatus Limnocylindrales bacterium]|nr:cytochrome c [Candidatus Limnocylindrales bacterium]
MNDPGKYFHDHRRFDKLPRWVTGSLDLLFFLTVLILFIVPMTLGVRAESNEAAPQEKKGQTNPFSGDPKSIQEGKVLYGSTCVICHGKKGGRGPDLTSTRLSNEAFIEVVLNGRKGTQMPAWREKLSEEEIWKILAYLEDLKKSTTPR